MIAVGQGQQMGAIGMSLVLQSSTITTARAEPLQRL